jgi:uncharacterized protein YndB with AHSA1/START domain
MQQTNPVITVATTVNASVQKVWAYYTQPQHITQWNQASPDWHCPKAENDLRIGGKFSSTMAANDGSFSFDFWGIYDDILENELMMYTMGDGRKATISFASNGDITEVVTNFEPEQENSLELQQGGWQAILDSFKNYTETN